MAQFSGRKGSVAVEATGEQVVEELRSWTLTSTVNTDDGSQMGDDWDRQNVISYAWSGQIVVRHDGAAAGQALLVEGSEVDLVFYETGNTSGQLKITGKGLITGVDRGADVGSSVERTYSYNGQGAYTETPIA